MPAGANPSLRADGEQKATSELDASAEGLLAADDGQYYGDTQDTSPADVNGKDCDNLGKTCTMLGKTGTCISPSECTSKNGGHGHTPVIGGCGSSWQIVGTAYVKKYGSAGVQCCVEEDSTCSHNPKTFPKPKYAKGKKVYTQPSSSTEAAVKAGKGLFTCDSAYGGGLCIPKEQCIDQGFVPIFDLVSAPYLFFGADWSKLIVAMAGRQSGYTCNKPTISWSWLSTRGGSTCPATQNYAEHFSHEHKDEQEHRKLHTSKDQRELGLISWIKDKAVKAVTWIKDKAATVYHVVGKWVSYGFVKIIAFWSGGYDMTQAKYVCCVKPTCASTCSTPSTSTLKNQPKCRLSWEVKPGDKGPSQVALPAGTQWVSGFCPSSITQAQETLATSGDTKAAEYTKDWYKLIDVAFGPSSMQCPVPDSGPLDKTFAYFDGVPLSNVIPLIDLGAGTARHMLAADTDASKYGILTHANIPSQLRAQIATVTEPSIEPIAPANGLTSQFSAAIGKTGFKGQYDYFAINQAAALALTDSITPITASSMVNAVNNGKKSAQPKGMNTIVVTVTHEFQDDATGSLAAAIASDLDTRRDDAFTVRAEIQLMFSKYAYVMVSEAIKKSTGASRYAFNDDTLAYPDVHNVHVAKSLMNSISFNAIGYHAADAPRDEHGRFLAAPKAKGVQVSYNVAVSVNAVAVATGGKLKTSSQVAT